MWPSASGRIIDLMMFRRGRGGSGDLDDRRHAVLHAGLAASAFEHHDLALPPQEPPALHRVHGQPARGGSPRSPADAASSLARRRSARLPLDPLPSRLLLTAALDRPFASPSRLRAVRYSTHHDNLDGRTKMRRSYVRVRIGGGGAAPESVRGDGASRRTRRRCGRKSISCERISRRGWPPLEARLARDAGSAANRRAAGAAARRHAADGAGAAGRGRRRRTERRAAGLRRRRRRRRRSSTPTWR